MDSSDVSVASWWIISAKERQFMGGIFPNSKECNQKSAEISFLWKLLFLLMRYLENNTAKYYCFSRF